MNSVNIAALVLRLAVGGTMIAHGWNHAFGGGKLPGTARWLLTRATTSRTCAARRVGATLAMREPTCAPFHC